MKTLSAVLAMAVVAATVTSVKATQLTGSFDTVYSDNFAAPVTNVNAAGTDPNAIVGNAPAVATGLDGGSATATYLGALSTSTTAAPDTNWDYSGSNSASITSPPANVSATGTTAGEDTNTISNLALPLVPVSGMTYDLELTMKVPAATGGHGLEMGFLWNNGNARLTSSGQAISNDDPAGLILLRDVAQAGGNIADIFEAINTNGDTPVPVATSGPVGSTVTFDELFTPTSATAGNFSWYVNGILINPTPVNITGLTGGISDIQFGDNRITGGVLTNFSVTAQAPEPASLGIAAVGALALVARRRR